MAYAMLPAGQCPGCPVRNAGFNAWFNASFSASFNAWLIV
jgi:hypothetical protein